jgi:F-type H+-transporting ATPase subunit epsilon
MQSFDLLLYDATHKENLTGVSSFVGEDKSGCFGILPNHERFMTILIFGLARFKIKDQPWQYLALPGAVLYFNNNQLAISTRHFLIDSDYTRISSLLEQQLLTEEEDLYAMRTSLHRMEEEMLKLLWSSRKKGVDL